MRILCGHCRSKIGEAKLGPLWGSQRDDPEVIDVIIRGPEKITVRDRFGQAVPCANCGHTHPVRRDRLRAAYDRAVSEGRKRITLPNDLR